MPVMLAEAAYRDRFLGSPPVVPNTTPVPDAARPSLPGRVVYLGSLSLARGVAEMIELASRIRPEIEVHLIGPADQQSTALLRAAVADGILVWKGPIRNRAALQSISGATAGLALLHDHANYRHSLPTKVIEYMAYGVPAITTPLPIARDIVCKYECGEVVPFASVDDVVHAVRRLNDEDLVRRRMGERGHAAALQHFNWNRDAPRFVRTMEKFATEQAAPI
jgi:glycosyltransferase involved in cell wall biosynthesis